MVLRPRQFGCDVVRGHLAGLPSVVGTWVGASGVVCAEDAQVAGVVFFHQPDEAVPEHGVGGFEEVKPEVVEAVEIGFDVREEFPGGFHFDWGEGFEKPVVVDGH